MRYSPFRHLGALFLKKRPLQLTLFLTRRCNARCTFCFYLAAGRACPETTELTLPELAGIADSFGKLLWLAFSGGEIFLRQDLADIAELFYQKNQPAIILLPTNGLLPETILTTTEEILKRCPKSTVVVKISVDGPPEIHDAMRGVPGAHHQAMATYDRLAGLLERYANFELGINTVFCADNQDSMLEHLQTVGKLTSCKTHTVSLIRGDIANPAQKKTCPKKYQQVIAKMAAALKKTRSGRYRFSGARLKAAQDIVQRRLILRTVQQQRQLLPCYAGRLTLVITESGDVYPCESFQGKFGNLREVNFDLAQLLRGTACQEKLAAINRRECHCHHECYMMINILFNPRYYPALLQEYCALGSAGRRSGTAGLQLQQPFRGPEPEQTPEPGNSGAEIVAAP